MRHPEKVASEIINEITSAFKGVSREGGVSLHETGVIDDYGSDAERAKARVKDTDVNWQDVPNSTIEKPDLSLNFLDPIGFRYYIPVYMIWQIEQLWGEEEWVDCNTHSAALYFLASDGPEHMRKWKLSYYEILTEAQSHAIYNFLFLYTEYGDEYDKERAQRTIDNYWIKFR